MGEGVCSKHIIHLHENDLMKASSVHNEYSTFKTFYKGGPGSSRERGKNMFKIRSMTFSKDK